MFKEFLYKIIKLSIQNSKFTLTFFGLLSLISILFFVGNIKIETSTENLISQELEFKKKSRELKKLFPILKNNNIIVFKGNDQKKLEAKVTEILNNFSEQHEIFNFYFSPQTDIFFNKNLLSLADDETKEEILNNIYDIQPIISQIDKGPKLSKFNSLLELLFENKADINYQQKFKTILQKFSNSLETKEKVDWKSQFVSNNFYYIIFSLDENHLKASGFANFYNYLIDIKNLNEEFEISFTGSQILDYEEIQSVVNGATKAGILSIFLISIILFLAFRNVFIILSLILSIFVGLSITLGLTTIIVGSLNIISIAFAVLFIGISVDFGIQISLRILESQYNLKNIDVILKKFFPSLILVAITSIVGFLSFIPTDYRGLSELGQISAIGVVIGFITNLLFLPCLLKLNKESKIENKNNINLSLINTFKFLNNNKKKVLFFISIVIFFAVININKINFNSDPMMLKDQNSQSVKLALELLDKDPSSDYKISIFQNNFNEKKLLELSKKESVKSIFRLKDLFELEDDEDINHLRFLLTVNDKTFYSKPEVFEKFKENLQTLSSDEKSILSEASNNLLNIINQKKEISYEEMEFFWFAKFHELSNFIRQLIDPNQISQDQIPKFFLDRFISQNKIERIEVYPKNNIVQTNNLDTFVNEVVSVYPNAIGMPIIQNEAGKVVIEAFMIAFIISFICLLIISFFVFKKKIYIFLSIFPLLLSAILSILIFWFFKINFNFANMISLPLLFSLGISYTIFILKRYQELNDVEKLLNSFTPNAVLFSGLTTMCSFSTLAISNHYGTSSMGVMLFINLFFALFSSLIILPLIIKLLEKKL